MGEGGGPADQSSPPTLPPHPLACDSPPMKAYLVLDFSITDLAGFRPYIEAIPAHIARHNGRYIVRGAAPTPIEGDWAPERLVILEFATRADAEAFLAD